MANSLPAAREAAKALGELPQQLAAIDRMTTSELTELYRALFGEPTRSRNGEYLRKRLSWRVQELAEGGLAPQTLSKIVELGDELPERWRRRLEPQNPAPAVVVIPGRDSRLPPAGTVLRRAFKGATHEVTVHEDEFEYAGQRFKSLSAVAKHITGTQWNGLTFFGLQGGAKAQAVAP